MGNKLTSLLCTRRRRKTNTNRGTAVVDSSDEEEAAVQSPPLITWKHLWPMDQTRDALAKSPFFRIPNEIFIEIFRLLSVDDLANVSLVCRSFKMIADRDEIWQSKCKTPNKLWSKSFKEIYMDWIYEIYLCNQQFKKSRKKHWSSKTGVSREFYGINDSSSRYCRFLSEDKMKLLSITNFQEHPNSSPEMVIQLSVDIDRTAPQLISLLEKASVFEDLLSRPEILKQMMMRYNRFMQLKASLPDNIYLVPTLDIEIIWQTHLLRPEMYRKDCLRLFHRVLDHSLLTDEIGQCIKQQAFLDTCQLYQQRFGEHYCSLSTRKKIGEPALKYGRSSFELLPSIMQMYSYWDETHFDFASELPIDYENLFSFTEDDVILDQNWLDLCKTFMFEIASNEGFDPSDTLDLSFSSIEQLKKSYERFLYIAAQYKPVNGYESMPPTYAIDIIWRSHMQEPLKYASDCLRLIGYVIDHVRWSSIEKDQMEKLREKIIDIWKQEFHREMITDHFYNTNNNFDRL